ncbi:WD repeat, SAM and U-box domain-containing protein 1-like isoform X2 [Palaemon carinicauda]|uniref:WD repeat, SAM and U-box domain-containing protein 1-like isoform X2 n=1 Tax=Palaemon carinicauda TaxID=392227 RepID=UPI0035B57742
MDGLDEEDHFRDLELIRERYSVFSRNKSIGSGNNFEDSMKKPAPVCTLKDHTNDVTCVDFAGRNLLATGSSDKSIRVYKWQVGDQFVEVKYSPLIGHTYAVNSIHFSPFGTKLASASTDGSTIIWDVKTGDRLCALTQSSDAALRVCAFSTNSALLATGGDDDTASLWDVSTLSLLRQMNGDESTVTTVGFTPDSSYLATGSSGGELRVWDARYGHSVPIAIKSKAHDLGVSTLHFSPAIGKEDSILGKQYLMATGGQDNELRLWVVEVGGQIVGGSSSPVIAPHHTLQGHAAAIMCVRFSTSGHILASASGDKTVRLWDPIKLIPLGVLEGHKRYVTSCAFSDDGALLVAGSGDRVIHIWKVEGVTSAVNKTSGASQAGKRLLARFPSQRYRQNIRVIDWNSDDVCGWLTEQGLAEYSHNFRSQAIDGRELLTMTDEILEKKLGVDALGHRNKILRLIQKSGSASPAPKESINTPPKEYLCPITKELISDPVLCADGFTYERVALEAWLADGKRTSPMTNEKLSHLTLTPNRTLRTLIQRYKEESI